MLGEFVGCDFLEFEVHGKQDGLFHLEDLLFGKFLPANFVVDGVHFEGVDFFILGGGEHGSDAHDVEI